VVPADQTAKVIVSAPFVPAKATLTFQVTVTDTTTGLTTSSSATGVKIGVNATPPDTINITSVIFRPIVSRVGAPAEFGKFSVVATSTALPAPPGMTMTASLVNDTLPATMIGSTALPINLPLLLTAVDPAGTPVGAGVCGPTPCWTTLVNGVIADTRQTPGVFVAPTLVTVRSSLGGVATITPANPLFVIR